MLFTMIFASAQTPVMLSSAMRDAHYIRLILQQSPNRRRRQRLWYGVVARAL